MCKQNIMMVDSSRVELLIKCLISMWFVAIPSELRHEIYERYLLKGNYDNQLKF